MNQGTLSAQARTFNWLLNNFVENTVGVEQALAVSADGLLMAVSTNVDRASADRLAAVVSGMASLADGVSRMLAKRDLRQVIVEMDDGFFFVSSISGGSRLGVVAGRGADLGLIGYETTMLVARAGATLTPQLIAELKSSLAL